MNENTASIIALAVFFILWVWYIISSGVDSASKVSEKLVHKTGEKIKQDLQGRPTDWIEDSGDPSKLLIAMSVAEKKRRNDWRAIALIIAILFTPALIDILYLDPESRTPIGYILYVAGAMFLTVFSGVLIKLNTSWFYPDIYALQQIRVVLSSVNLQGSSNGIEGKVHFWPKRLKRKKLSVSKGSWGRDQYHYISRFLQQFPTLIWRDSSRMFPSMGIARTIVSIETVAELEVSVIDVAGDASKEDLKDSIVSNLVKAGNLVIYNYSMSIYQDMFDPSGAVGATRSNKWISSGPESLTRRRLTVIRNIDQRVVSVRRAASIATALAILVGIIALLILSSIDISAISRVAALLAAGLSFLTVTFRLFSMKRPISTGKYSQTNANLNALLELSEGVKTLADNDDRV